MQRFVNCLVQTNMTRFSIVYRDNRFKFYFLNKTNTNERLNTRHFFTHKVVYMHLKNVSSKRHRTECLTTRAEGLAAQLSTSATLTKFVRLKNNTIRRCHVNAVTIFFFFRKT